MFMTTSGVREESPNHKIMCRLCKDTISPSEQHEKVACKCGEIFIENTGVRGARNLNNIIDSTEQEGLIE